MDWRVAREEAGRLDIAVVRPKVSYGEGSPLEGVENMAPSNLEKVLS